MSSAERTTENNPILQPVTDSTLNTTFSPTPVANTEDKLHTVESAFTPNMINALKVAEDKFAVKIYTKEVSAADVRAVVLAGESHIKGRTASKLGVELLEAFPVRGLEGVQMDKTVCDRITGAVMAPYFFTLKLAARGFTSFSSKNEESGETHIEKLRSSKSYMRGSTIYDAKLINAKGEDGKDLPTENLHLEQGGTKPTILGEVSKLLAAVPFLTFEAMAINFVAGYIPVIGPAIQSSISLALPIAQRAFDISIFAGLLAYLIPKNYRDNQIFGNIYRTLNVRTEWLETQRNELMVKNLLEHAESQNYRSPVLNIVGALHVAGMGELLEREGWKKNEDILGKRG